MAYLEVNNLTVGYEGKPVSSNINFSVNKGEYVYVIGENGAGKSTLMKTLLGLIKPIEGEIHYEDSNMKIGYLSQLNSLQKDFPATVWEVVLSGTIPSMGNRFFYGKKEKMTAKVNIEKLGIEKLCKKSYRDLSGGQKQRVMFARALCAAKEFLLLDEPVNGLDPLATEEMYQVVKKLNEDGVTIIMISHDMRAAIKYADRILFLSEEGAFFGNVDEFIKTETELAAMIGGKRNA